ncbi:hypothetical protein [Pedobacter agri]|uniref:Uncharacterized protein n=1 Tax=Pedobacter agri TaxID=454586 RepID=A0A9X3IAP3_9SPHI|nr:hypothetical protein [Pedobacter agri]MCX3266575.1 hypothetical protein [Pedobacter agri]
MKKLPMGEAAFRQRERVRMQNEKLKLDTIKRKLAAGNISRLTEARKKQMREYIRTKRGQPIDDKIVTFLNLTPEQLDRKRKDEKNEKAKAKRLAEREAGLRVDKRRKEHMTYTHHKIFNAKPKPPRKPQTAKVKKMGKVVKEAKPMKIVNSSLDGKIPLIISPKLTVYIRPDQDAEAVRAKYLNR